MLAPPPPHTHSKIIWGLEGVGCGLANQLGTDAKGKDRRGKGKRSGAGTC